MATENRCGQTTATGLVCNERLGHAGKCRGPRPSNMAGMAGHVSGSGNAGRPRQTRQAGPFVVTFRVATDTLEFGDAVLINGTWFLADGLPGSVAADNRCVETATLAGTTLYAVQVQGLAKPVVTTDDVVTVAYLQLPGTQSRAEWDGRNVDVPAVSDTADAADADGDGSPQGAPVTNPVGDGVSAD